MKPRAKAVEAGTQRLKDIFASGGDAALHVCKMDYTSEEQMTEETFKKLKARIA